MESIDACDRKFYIDAPHNPPQAEAPVPHSAAAVEMRLAALRNDIVGASAQVDTPFGTRTLCYADWSASGRALHSVETALLHEVLPLYGNTHSTSSATGLQSTCYLAEARAYVGAALRARCQYDGRSDGGDAVLFCGAGATACCAKLVQLLGMHVPWPSGQTAEQEHSLRPVVFVGPFEHHSSLLAWRESCARVIQLPENAAGTGVCRAALARALVETQSACVRLGCFSAASNVTGVTEDTASLAAQLHAGGALAVFDYAGASGGMDVCMNPAPVADFTAADVAADAVFLSPHKLPGGPGAHGVLVIKRALLRQPVPSVPGGGTVFWVDSTGHSYVTNPEDREQGGTQDVIAACRAALALRTRRTVDEGNSIAMRAHTLAAALDAGLRRHPNVCVLGPPVGQEHTTLDGATGLRLPVCSFLVRGPRGAGRWLHHGFVTALLNDMFGVQARAGCACAGPYGLRLLGADHPAVSSAIEDALRRKTGSLGEGLRPGWTRVSFSFCCSMDDVAYVVAAVHAVASRGWVMLPQYRLDPASGEWRHVSRGGAAGRMPQRKWLAHTPLPWSSTGVSNHSVDGRLTSVPLVQQLADATAVFDSAGSHPEVNALASSSSSLATCASDTEPLRWLVLPTEAALLLRQERNAASPQVFGGAPASGQEAAGEWTPLGPIQPRTYTGTQHADDSYLLDQSSSSTEHSSHVAAAAVATVAPSSRGLRSRRDADACEPLYADSSALATLRPTTPAAISAAAAAVADYSSRDSDWSVSDIYEGDSAANGAVAGELPVVPTASAGRVAPPPRKLLANVARTVARFDMIRAGDRLLVGLSGGKDSLTLLHTLLHMRARSPVPFTIAVATVDPGAEGFDPAPLRPYVQSLGVPYHFLANHIMDDAASGSMQGDSICSFCARMKRGALYRCCTDNGYNVLALGQHADDVAESALLSAFHNGALRTMKACYVSGTHGVRVIRPLVAVRERATRDFAYAAGLPVIADNCPACFEAPKQRRRVKQLLKKEETAFPHCVANFSAALLPLLDPRAQAVLRAIRTELDAKQKGNTRHGQQQQKKAAEAGRSQADDALLASLSDDALLAELVARGGCGVTAAHVAATLGAEEAAEDAESAVAAVCTLIPLDDR